MFQERCKAFKFRRESVSAGLGGAGQRDQALADAGGAGRPAHDGALAAGPRHVLRLGVRDT